MNADTYTARVAKVTGLVIFILIVLLSSTDAGASPRTSQGAFAPDGSLTLHSVSNTNVVRTGYKGAYGVYGILLPREGRPVPHERMAKDTGITIINTPQTDTGTIVPPVVSTPIVDIPIITETPVEPPIVTPVSGNPGNDKNTGKAGEKCNKSMCENSDGETGEHGKSHND